MPAKGGIFLFAFWALVKPLSLLSLVGDWRNPKWRWLSGWIGWFFGLSSLLESYVKFMRQSTQLPPRGCSTAQLSGLEDLLNVLTRVRGYSTAATFICTLQRPAPSALKRRRPASNGGWGSAADRIEHIEDCHIKSFNGRPELAVHSPTRELVFSGNGHHFMPLLSSECVSMRLVLL